MNKNSRVKLVFIIFFVLLFSLSITPGVNGFFTKHDLKTILDSIDDKKNQKTEYETTNSEYELLIITPKKFNGSLQPLVDHKYSAGVPTKIFTLEYIYDEVIDGRDNAEKIKYFIKQSIEEWNISYVLLIGGRRNQFSLSEEWWLPVRYIKIFVEHWNDSEFFISDLYYADIYDTEGNFSSWDTNENDIFGEWSGIGAQDRYIDLCPDVYVGRLPCRNIFEVKIMVNKIITYEKGKCADSWFRNMVVAAGDAIPENDIFDGEVETQKALEYMTDFNHIRLWASWGTLTSRRDVIREINKGCGFLYLNGHGTPAGWSTHPPNSKEWIFGLDIYHMPLLLNGGKLPICIVDGCWCSKFNVSILSPLYDETIPVPIFECFSWRLTRKIGGGSIATLGNTGLGYPAAVKIDPSKGGGNDLTGIYFFQEYGENGTDILGKIWGTVIEKYLQFCPINWAENDFNDTSIDIKTVEQWTIFGDPSLKIGGYHS
jgi:hypothetical protein